MLRELCQINGVSGDEDEIRDYIRSRIGDHVDDLTEDAYGNLIVRKGKPRKPRVMLAAHMDEVGFMITALEKTGMLKFKTIGLLPQTILAKRVIIGKRKINGVIGHMPIHMSSEEDRKKLPEIKQLFIDIGAVSREEAAERVEIGELGTFDTEFHKDGNIMFGKGFDNRIGCYILMKMILDADLPAYYAFTVQEEAGLRGARIAGYSVQPDIAFAVDTTSANEFPSEKDVPNYPVLGKGPAITVADSSVICDRGLVKLLVETAQKNGIPCQAKQPMIGGTDAGAIHTARGGSRTAVLAIPARYIHSPLSIAMNSDIKAGISLLSASLRKIYRGAN
jgi:endoglucanase